MWEYVLPIVDLVLLFIRSQNGRPMGLSIPVQPVYDVNNLDLVQSIFEIFIVNYNRSYSGSEKIQRFEYFKQNLALINKLNDRNPEAVFDINKFVDWSPEEKNPTMKLKSRRNIEDASSICNPVQVKPGMFSEAPESFDWKDHGAVTPIKDQGQCGSCWAHAVVGAAEGQYAIKYNQQIVLSEQQLVDCVSNVSPCSGVSIDEAYETVIKEGGLMLQNDYQYKAKRERCRFNKSKIAAKVIGCRTYETNSTEGPLKEVLYNVGPLTVDLAGEGFHHYTRGILTGKYCAFHEPSHAVILTGYGSENGRDFWNVKNSFGESFGENGYIRIERGVGCLGIGEYAAASPVVDFE